MAQSITGKSVRIVECPRDAMQGWKTLIPTPEKIRYLQALLKVGFDTLDCGSLVSHRLVPQMADTLEVLEELDPGASSTRLLVIVGNLRGVEQAASHPAIDAIGYPFSVSEAFQRRNTNQGLEDALETASRLISLCSTAGKQAVIYISMGFGNPYGDPYSPEIVCLRVEELVRLGAKTISLADTVGVAHPETIRALFAKLIPQFPEVEFGAHFHSRPQNWKEKIHAADQQGCRRFDSAILGIGGCPMAEDELVGNLDTENLVGYFRNKDNPLPLDQTALQEAIQIAREIFKP